MLEMSHSFTWELCGLAVALCIAVCLPPDAAAEETRLLRNPAVSGSHVAFVYANDIWVQERAGGEPRRLTTFAGAETQPHFSPDGGLIAFSGEYDGNLDVYVVAAQGGEPRRLTWHPMDDEVRGWSPDGKYVLFASARSSVPTDYPKLWRVSVEGGLPEPLPLPRAAEGKYSPDGKRFVYQDIAPWETEWRNYRGGQNNPVRIIDLETLAVEKLPWEGSNDNTPVWLDGSIYFLSDRDQTMNVWSYDPASKELRQRSFFTEFDCKNLEAGGGRLIFENGGWLHLLDPAADKPEKLSLTVRGDFPLARPHWKHVVGDITSWGISPTGQRAVFEARGEIFTVPAKKGDVRNLTASSGSAERSPVWSPDGKRISWFSDESGEYQLVLADQDGKNKKTVKLDKPSFFYTPAWSPDSKLISFGDAHRNLWLLDLQTEQMQLIDNEGFTHPDRTIAPAWSPDSKWIAYVKRLKNQHNAVFLYSVEQKKSFQLTDGLADCISPAWDEEGKYLYFLSSTEFGLNVGWSDMSSWNHPVRRAVCLAVLAADEPSPLLPESDEENKPDPEKKKQEQEKKAAAKDGKEKKQAKKSKDSGDEEKKPKKAVKVKIDLEGIGQRIIRIDVPARDYVKLAAGKAGTIFYLERSGDSDFSFFEPEKMLLRRWTLRDREEKDFLKDLREFDISADREKLLYGKGWGEWSIAETDGTPEIEGSRLNASDMRMRVDPKQEWRQIFREAWRFQRDFFYVRNVHGLDLDWAWRTYAPWVKHVRHRADLTYILDILGGETAVGHSFVGGGDEPYSGYTPVGLLGADFSIEQGKFRLKKIYGGEHGNRFLRAPLRGPGIKVKEGDFLLAVNGVELNSSMNPYSLFEETAGRQTVLTLNGKPDMKGSREVTVVPTGFDFALRVMDWVRANRKKVDELSGGRLAYVWLPNTSLGGYNFFNRDYFAQQDKQGSVIDERYNSGGAVPDYIIDLLGRELLGFFNNAAGDKQPYTLPNAGIWGPKVMIINESAGSGGDLLPYMFRAKKIGPLVGTRTWGGLVGIWDTPQLVDGGYLTVPRGGFYNLKGEWDVENKGVEPDIVVEQEPAAVSKGHDPQLEKAVEVALELLKTQETRIPPQPPDPVRARQAVPQP
ncbi:MAG: S41 family peptidase [Candidatus Electronema sp. V4]|uniref:S41 family peptidase n=1 Tax=Candidatus Electronema sp. V4 TaxID=3454756 RepID=UPI0040554567